MQGTISLIYNDRNSLNHLGKHYNHGSSILRQHLHLHNQHPYILRGTILSMLGISPFLYSCYQSFCIHNKRYQLYCILLLFQHASFFGHHKLENDLCLFSKHSIKWSRIFLSSKLDIIGL